MSYPPKLTPIQGCARPSEADAIEGTRMGDKYGALWPKYLCTCPTCGTQYVWCGAHYESGAHYTCDGCCGWPFCSCKVKHTGSCRPEAA